MTHKRHLDVSEVFLCLLFCLFICSSDTRWAHTATPASEEAGLCPQRTHKLMKNGAVFKAKGLNMARRRGSGCPGSHAVPSTLTGERHRRAAVYQFQAAAAYAERPARSAGGGTNAQ